MSLTYSIEIKNNISGETAYVDLVEKEDAVLLGGKFTLQQLEQIVALMRNRDEKEDAVLLQGKFTLQQLEQIVALMRNRDEQSEEALGTKGLEMAEKLAVDINNNMNKTVLDTAKSKDKQ